MATQFDPEMDEFTRQQAFADVLRKQSMEQGGQMMGRMFVPKSGLQSFAEGAAGGYMGASANQGRLALDQQRQQQVADFLRNKPSATSEVQPAGPMPDGSNMAPIQQAKPWQQQAQETRDWASGGANIRNPLAQSVAQMGIQQSMMAPEAAAKREDEQAARRESLTQTLAARALEKSDQRAYDEKRDAKYKLDATEQSRLADARIAAMMGKIGANNKQLEPEDQAMLSAAILEGRLDPAKVNSRNRDVYLASLRADPKADLNDLTGVAAKNRATETEFSAKGISGRSVRAINTAVDHLETLRGLGDALKNGDIQAFNTIGNIYAKQTGSAAPTNFDTAKQIVAQEVVKSIVPGGGGVTERQELAKQILSASSPEQLAGFIDTSHKLMGGQLQSLEKSYAQDDEGKKKRFGAMLLPKSVDALTKARQGEGGKKTVVREVNLKDGRTGVEYSDGTRGFK